jgi:uncharacterized protein YdcH (DUF465 family)
MNINSQQHKMENDNEDEHEQLDDKWITEYENTDKLYKDFYKDNIYYIQLTLIYVNKNNDIDKIKHNPFLLNKPNILTQEELIGILKQNSIVDNKLYSLLSLLRYNIHLNPTDVRHFLKKNEYYDYLSILKNINDIHFEQTIHMFHDLNDMIIIFYEKQKNVTPKSSKNITKKVYFNQNISTKENKKHKKTRKTLYE